MDTNLEKKIVKKLRKEVLGETRAFVKEGAGVMSGGKIGIRVGK